MGRELRVFIPGRIPSPNHMPRNTYLKNRLVQSMREEAWLRATSALNEKRWLPFTGRATISFTMYRMHLFDKRDNANTCLKYSQDGLCWLESRTKVLLGRRTKTIVSKKPGVLPKGDGPNSGYEFLPVTQVKVKTEEEEGVLIVITEDS